MPTQAQSKAPRKNTPRHTTMVCADCDVTWRGLHSDECWSCGESGRVQEATPRRVRLTPATTESERLVG